MNGSESSEIEGPQTKEDNDNWSARSEVWGEEFCITIRSTGNKAKGEVPHGRVNRAIEDYLLMEEHSFEPGNLPDSPGELPQMPRKSRRFVSERTIVTLWLTGPRDLLSREFDRLCDLAENAVPDDWEVMGNVE